VVFNLIQTAKRGYSLPATVNIWKDRKSEKQAGMAGEDQRQMSMCESWMLPAMFD
jgi:hypothetical protein